MYILLGGGQCRHKPRRMILRSDFKTGSALRKADIILIKEISSEMTKLGGRKLRFDALKTPFDKGSFLSIFGSKIWTTR